MPARRPEELLGAVRHELARQDGVVSRRQVLASGLRPHDLERLLRRHVLAPLCRGVLVDHTGVPTWRQRAWGAVLALEPAAVVGQSALDLAGGVDPAPGRVVHVGISGHRAAPAPLPGVSVRHLSGLDDAVHWHLAPPRQRLEEAVLDVAVDAQDRLAAVAVLAAAVGSRLTTADRLTSALTARARIADRRWIAGVLADVAAGTCSVLEHGQLTLVERPHGLPRAERQRPERGRRAASTATRRTAGRRTSSSTAGSTSASRPVTPTSTATSTSRPPAGRPSGSASGRSTAAPARPPPG